MATLTELYEKQTKNNKLNKGESKEAYELLLEFIFKEDDLNSFFHYVMTFAPEVGVAALTEYVIYLDEEDSVELIEKFLNNDEFVENASYKSLKRGIAFAAMLYEKDPENLYIQNIISKVFEVTINKSKGGVNSKINEYVQREFLNRIDDCFFESFEFNSNITEKEFANITKILFNSAFTEKRKVKINTKTQIQLLKWLSNFNKTIILNDEEKELLNKSVVNWPDELKNAFIDDENFKRYYFDYLDLTSKETKNEECDTKSGKTIELDETEKMSQEKTNNNTNQDSYSLSNLIRNLEVIKTQLIENDKEVKNLRVNLKFYQDENAKLKNEKEKYRKSTEELTSQYKETINKNNELNKEVSYLAEKNKEMLDKEKEYKKEIQMLYDTSNILDTNSLEEFKNKLTSKLKHEYQDFKEIEGESIDIEMGEILKIKFNKVFKELIKQGIELE